MARVQVFVVDSFTRKVFSGNPAGVVLGGEGLGEARMRQIARELNHSETAFVLPPEGPDHDVRVRFFTPRTEVPLCGHATVAAHYVRAVAGGTAPGRYRQLTGAGSLPVEILRDGEDYRIRMTQGPPVFEPPLGEDLAEAVWGALGLGREDRGDFAPVQVVSTGHSKVLVPVRRRSALDALAPDMEALVRLSRVLGCNGYFPFTLDDPDPGSLTQGRMFAPAIGVREDPVTGNAHGPLGAYLIRHALVPRGDSLRFRGSQGDSSGRCGYLDVEVDLEEGEPRRVSILGDAVLVFRADLDL